MDNNQKRESAKELSDNQLNDVCGGIDLIDGVPAVNVTKDQFTCPYCNPTFIAITDHENTIDSLNNHLLNVHGKTQGSPEWFHCFHTCIKQITVQVPQAEIPIVP